MKLTDKAILRMVSESPGRNTSEPRPVPKLGPAGIDERTVPLEIKLKL